MDIKHNKKVIAILFALMAAVFYAINMPFSKMLLSHIPSTILAGILYLGAGIGIGVAFLFNAKKIEKSELLAKSDLPYTIGMIVLDILAPISLMYGLQNTTSVNASLLNNFEIVATTVIALAIFKETISKRLWLSISFVTISSFVLSVEDVTSFQFSWGSLFVLLAAVCWGLENNCTRKISSKNTFEIVTIKGVCSGIGSMVIGFVIGEKLPSVGYILLALLLGFVAYGLSIFFYIRAQKELGAAKTSAYYAAAPFIGVLLSFVILKEPFTIQYLIALMLMIIGTAIATYDTLMHRHSHLHKHLISHTHDGSTHTHEITHAHEHRHFLNEGNHEHRTDFSDETNHTNRICG